MHIEGPSNGKVIMKRRSLPHPIDVKIGIRIRTIRQGKRPLMSQGELARHVGCAVAQIQKYESARNRVAISRLYEIAAALGISIHALLRPISL
jgi:transcriptional regulator with XRE-family HTH domain